MTFQIKIRGVADRPIAAEYSCPVHGRFDVTIARDAHGDAPSSAPCPRFVTWLESGWAQFGENGEVTGGDTTVAPVERACGVKSLYVISAPRVSVRRVEAVKGSWQKPERKTWLDTRNLGEGQDLDEWRDERAAIRDQQRRDSLKELLND